MSDRVFTHALALSGGPAWQQLPLGDERSQGSLLDKTASVRNDHQAKHRRTSTSLAAGEAGEAGVQVRCYARGERRYKGREGLRFKFCFGGDSRALV